MNEQELFSERMNGLLDLATDKGGILSKGEIHFYLKDVLQSEDQYEFVYQFFAEKGVRVEGWRGVAEPGGKTRQKEDSESGSKTKTKGGPKLSGETKQKRESEQRGKAMHNAEHGKSALDSSSDGGYEDIEDFTGLMGGSGSANTWETYGKHGEDADTVTANPDQEWNTETNGSDNEDAEEEGESASNTDSDEEERDSAFDTDSDEEEGNSAFDMDDLPLPAAIDESVLTEDEKRYLKYYQADIDRIEPVTEAERNSLLNALAAGDPSVMNRLVEGHLYLVMEEIAAYLHAGVPVGDLIQEASIGLIEGIQSYRGMNFEAHVRYAIREALDVITEEQQASDSVAKHLLDSINRADEATRKLSEDFGRAPTKEELAEYLHMDVDEVETLLKHSIDALTVSVSDEAYGKTEDAEE